MKKSILIVIPLLIIIFLSCFLIFKPKSIEQIKNSVVKVIVYDENNNKIGTGSGFCSFYKNYIVTNYHVISGAYKIEILDDDKKIFDVTDIVIFDAENDLAIIETTGDFKPIKLGNGTKLEAGQKVTAIGSPEGVLNTVSTGIVSNADEEDYIRFTAPISPGSSGGVLLNEKKQVIGITTATYNSITAQNINFARNVEKLKNLYNALKDKKYAIIDSENYTQCNNTFFRNDITSDLIIKQCSFTGYDKYTTKNILDFYTATNEKSIFESILYNSVNEDIHNKSFINEYNNFSSEQQELVITYYNELKDYESCKNELSCKIERNKSSFEDWNVYQYILELDVLSRYELAIFLVATDNYKTQEQMFEYVKELDLDVGQKLILLIKFANHSLDDFVDSDIDETAQYIFDLSDDNDFLEMILEDLGYYVTYEDDSIVANW